MCRLVRAGSGFPAPCLPRASAAKSPVTFWSQSATVRTVSAWCVAMQVRNAARSEAHERAAESGDGAGGGG